MSLTIHRSVPVQRTGRVLQCSGMFDLPPAKKSEVVWNVDLAIDDRPWNIGLVVGPSGVGKSTIAREVFGPAVLGSYDWPGDKSILDAFPPEMGIKDITGLLSSVGFSSPPSWLRPFHVLSTGEQFRVFVARALAENPELVVIDEFTSVVDRTVAQIGSAAVAKAVRRSGRKLVAVTCHYDVLDWLQPDWVYQPATNELTWRCLQRRPELQLQIMRGTVADWQLFKNHHYLSATHHKGAYVFIGCIDGRPAGFISVLHFPHATRPGWREHRSVVLPDFQGIGIGNRMSEYVASLFIATGKPYRDTTGHPGHVFHRLKSPLWRCTRQAGLFKRTQGHHRFVRHGLAPTTAVDRITWSFEFIGPPNADDARRFHLLGDRKNENDRVRQIVRAIRRAAP